MGPLFGIVFFLIVFAIGGLLFASIYSLLTLGLKNSDKLIRLLISFLLTVTIGGLFVSNDFYEFYKHAVSKLTLFVIGSLLVVIVGFQWYKNQKSISEQYSNNDYEEDFYEREPLRDKLIRQFLLMITFIVFGLVFLSAIWILYDIF